MLQVIPSAIGQALYRVRPGNDALALHAGAAAGAAETIEVSSPAFAPGAPIPVRHSADGAGISPPLAWRGVPEGTRMLVLLIEDPDAPSPRPLVHALATDLPPGDGELDAGALPTRFSRRRPGMGRNSYFRRTYLPMDAIPGHGPHHYTFELFALDFPIAFAQPPGRAALLRGMRGHVLAKGALVGTYERP